MKTALLTGLAAFALGATCATALTGTGSAASTPTPVASTAGADDSCTGSSSTAPSCVVERILRLETPAPAASTGTQAAAADDDGTADQGRGDRPAPAATAPAAVPTAVAPPRAARPAAPAPVRTAERLRGDGSVDDSGPSAAAARADDDGTPDQGRGDRRRASARTTVTAARPARRRRPGPRPRRRPRARRRRRHRRQGLRRPVRAASAVPASGRAEQQDDAGAPTGTVLDDQATTGGLRRAPGDVETEPGRARPALRRGAARPYRRPGPRSADLDRHRPSSRRTPTSTPRPVRRVRQGVAEQGVDRGARGRRP